MVKASLYERLVEPLSDLLDDNGRVFDAQDRYDRRGDPKERDTPAEAQNEWKVQLTLPADEHGNAWPGVWGEYQKLTPYLEELQRIDVRKRFVGFIPAPDSTTEVGPR